MHRPKSAALQKAVGMRRDLVVLEIVPTRIQRNPKSAARQKAALLELVPTKQALESVVVQRLLAEAWNQRNLAEAPKAKAAAIRQEA